MDGNESDGDYFETGADGKVTLKKGKKKIDLTKLTKEDLKKLGIDSNASKEEIARRLLVSVVVYAKNQVMFHFFCHKEGCHCFYCVLNIMSFVPCGQFILNVLYDINIIM